MDERRVEELFSREGMLICSDFVSGKGDLDWVLVFLRSRPDNWEEDEADETDLERLDDLLSSSINSNKPKPQ